MNNILEIIKIKRRIFARVSLVIYAILIIMLVYGAFGHNIRVVGLSVFLLLFYSLLCFISLLHFKNQIFDIKFNDFITKNEINNKAKKRTRNIKSKNKDEEIKPVPMNLREAYKR